MNSSYMRRHLQGLTFIRLHPLARKAGHLILVSRQIASTPDAQLCTSHTESICLSSAGSTLFEVSIGGRAHQAAWLGVSRFRRFVDRSSA
jgi:hypothetical protein